MEGVFSMIFRFLGCILLIIGTCIGAGILALPLATAQAGFYPSCLLLIICWCISTATAFYLLEINLKLPANSNMISMARATLGGPGQVVAWVLFLLMLYSLLCAYLTGGRDVIRDSLSAFHIQLPSVINTLIFLFIFGYIVFRGMRSIDWANRGLMIGKLGILCLLFFLLMPHVSETYLSKENSLHALLPATMVMVTAFGFSVIVPSLRVYLESHVFLLRAAIFMGSAIALICYLLWLTVIHGVIDKEGPQGLIAIAHSTHQVSDLTQTLSHTLNNATLSSFIHLFTSICVITSFLGVSLGLSDFIADGVGVRKKGSGHIVVYVLTFLPPLAVTLFFPGAFIKALNYAGFFCIILFLLMPTLMAWQLRRRKKEENAYQVCGGNWLLGLSFLTSLSLLVIGILG